MNRICLSMLLLIWGMNLLGQSCDGFWESGFGRPGVFTPPKAMAYDETNDYLYVGDPAQFGGDPDIEKVGRWDGENWTGLGEFVCTSCGSGTINALEVSASGDLYIGGFFEGVIDANGTFIASKNVIKWDAATESFEALGFGVEANQVYALAYHHDTLIVGGAITDAKNIGGDIPINNIALYDFNAQAWSAMGAGIESYNLTADDDGTVYAIAHMWSGHYFVGGAFSKINGNQQVYSMAAWHPSGGWTNMGEGVRRINDSQTPHTFRPGIVRDITIDWATDNIYVAGDLGYFNAPGSGLARIDWIAGQTAWTYLTGLGNKPVFSGRWQTYDLYYDTYGQILYVGGDFNSDDADPFSPVPGEYVVGYDIQADQWFSLSDGITGPFSGLGVTAISKGPNDQIYVGGNFHQVDSLQARFLAGWDINAGFAPWDILGQGPAGACDEVFDVYFANQYIGGQFETLGGSPSPAVGWRINDTWLPGLLNANTATTSFYPPVIRAFDRGPLGTLVAGVFDSLLSNGLGNVAAAGMGYQDFIGLVHPLATSLGGSGNFQTVYDISHWQDGVVAGGTFTSIDGTSVQGLGYRDANGIWSELAAIGQGTVWTIFNDGDSLLYIGGNFRTVNGITVDGVAVYDGTSWSALGQGFGFYNNVYTFGKDSLTGEIAVGGGFFTAYQADGSSLASAGLAFWDGTQWNTRGEVGAQITNPAQYAQVVRAIEYAPDGTLFIGGEFSGVGNVAARRLARFAPGTGWQPVGDGVSGSDCNGYPMVHALGYYQEELMVGGKFSRAGNKQAHCVAYFDMSLNSTQIMPDTFDVRCDTTEIVGKAGYDNWQWSTGDIGPIAYVTLAYFDSLRQDNGRVWVYATAEKEGCLLSDSIEVAFMSIGLESIADEGYYNQGDSTYFWIKPAMDTAYVDYDIWIISMDTTLEFLGDTIAFQFPCPNTYRYSIRTQAREGDCSTHFLQKTAYTAYTTAREIIRNVETSGGDCLMTSAFGAPGGWENALWSNGESGQWALIDESFMQGADRKWLYLTADTTYAFSIDTFTCTFIDSVEMVRWENFDDAFDQQYTWTQGDSFRVDFYEDYVGNPYITTWDFGDGTPPYTVNLKWDTVNFPFTHYYPGEGSYTVTAITNAWGCSDSVDTVQFDVLIGTSSLREVAASPLRIFPNPNSGIFTLELPVNQPGPLVLRIQDVNGRLVSRISREAWRGGRIPIEAASLPAGIYRLEAGWNGQSYTAKLVVQ